MGSLASPFEFTSVATALVWPLAAGVAVVVWSKARAAARARRVAAMEGELKSLYRTIESKPIPPQLNMVLEALEEGEELAGAAAKGKKGTATAADS